MALGPADQSPFKLSYFLMISSILHLQSCKIGEFAIGCKTLQSVLDYTRYSVSCWNSSYS